MPVKKMSFSDLSWNFIIYFIIILSVLTLSCQIKLILLFLVPRYCHLHRFLVFIFLFIYFFIYLIYLLSPL